MENFSNKEKSPAINRTFICPFYFGLCQKNCVLNCLNTLINCLIVIARIAGILLRQGFQPLQDFGNSIEL